MPLAAVKALLDKELFADLVTKLGLSCKLVTFMTNDVARPTCLWVLLESKEFGGDLVKLLRGGCQIDYFRHLQHIGSMMLFGGDGMPTVNKSGPGARLLKTSPLLELTTAPGMAARPPAEPTKATCELILDVRAEMPVLDAVAQLRSFYDSVQQELGVNPLELAQRFGAGTKPER